MSFEERLADIAAPTARCTVTTGRDHDQFRLWHSRPDLCKAYFRSDEFEAFVVVDGDGCYSLVWHDYVANRWEEYLPTLGAAIMRLAHLVDCVVMDEGVDDLAQWLGRTQRRIEDQA